MQSSAEMLDISRLRRSCASCGLRELCLPAGISSVDLVQLDASVRDKRLLERRRSLYRVDDVFHSLFVVRSGSLKTFVFDDDGAEQVLGFHLPGEIVGVDALATGRHACHAEALERTSICELPYSQLQQVLHEVPALHRQLLRVISREVIQEHEHLITMGQQQAQARLAIFLKNLSDRYAALQRDGTRMSLSMSRQDIASYLGLAEETVCRLFTRLEEQGVLSVRRRAVAILEPDLLAALCHPSVRPDGAKEARLRACD